MKKINYFLIYLLFIAFWFRGNTLYWVTEKGFSPENYLQLQLNHKNPPDINQKPIQSIKVTNKEVFIISDYKCWILHYDFPIEDWYVEDWFSL